MRAPRLTRLAAVLAVAGSLGLGASGCGSQATTTHLSLAPMKGTTSSLQGLVKQGQPMAFDLESLGCVEGGGDLTVASVTLHAPSSGLAVVDWGAKASGRDTLPAGVFPLKAHSLSDFGLTHDPMSAACPHGNEQFGVVLKLTDAQQGTTAGLDVHFTNGTSAWFAEGLGLCRHWCPNSLGGQVVKAIESQQGGS